MKKKPKKFPAEPKEEDELTRLRREHRQLTRTLRERDQQIVFLASVVRRESETAEGIREVQQTMCRTVLAVADRVDFPDANDAAVAAWRALVDVAEAWLDDPLEHEELLGELRQYVREDKALRRDVPTVDPSANVVEGAETRKAQ